MACLLCFRAAYEGRRFATTSGSRIFTSSPWEVIRGVRCDETKNFGSYCGGLLQTRKDRLCLG